MKPPTAEMRTPMYVGRAGMRGQIWEGKARLYFGHVEFEVFKS